MAKASDAPVLSAAQVRAVWTQRHGLANPLAKRPATLVAKAGWLRTLGGIDVYLAIRARAPGVSRSAIDGAVAKGTLRVLPALRGCIYLVPETQANAALALAGALTRPRTARDLDKAGASERELADAAEAVLETLGDDARTTDEVRAALPAGALRSLGAKGKKVGMSSVLPAALRQLEFDGRIQRRLRGGRLDTERYVWAGVGTDAAPEPTLSEAVAAVVPLVLGAGGPLTVKQLATFIGVPQRDVKTALVEIDATEVGIEGWNAPAYVAKADARRLVDASVEPKVRFLPFNDTLLTLHGGPAPFVDPVHHELPVKVWGGRGDRVPLGQANHLGARPVLFGDSLIGFWEYDPDAERAVYGLLDDPRRGMKGALSDEAAAVSAFIRDELGHGRAFSLDTDDSLRGRAAWVRGLRWSK